jgi:hypothetical protein
MARSSSWTSRGPADEFSTGARSCLKRVVFPDLKSSTPAG